jgi:hypothetical protein
MVLDFSVSSAASAGYALIGSSGGYCRGAGPRPAERRVRHHWNVPPRTRRIRALQRAYYARE